MFTLGAALAAALPARAAAGKVVFGFLPTAVGVPGVPAMLKELQGKTEHDLGLALNYLPGNSGALALDAVHRAPADGSTVLLTPSSLMTLLPLLRKLPGADPVADFVPVAGLAELSLAFAIGPAVPASVVTLKQYVAWVHEHPMQAGYAVPGLGAVPHLLGAVMSDAAGLTLKAVAYKGYQSLSDDLLIGGIPSAFLPGSLASAFAASGKVRLLGVTSDQRWPNQPGLPTLRELGLIDFKATESYGLFLPARTPHAQVAALGAAVQQALRTPAVAAGLAEGQLRPWPGSAADYAAEIALERRTWAAAARQHAFSLDR